MGFARYAAQLAVHHEAEKAAMTCERRCARPEAEYKGRAQQPKVQPPSPSRPNLGRSPVGYGADRPTLPAPAQIVPGAGGADTTNRRRGCAPGGKTMVGSIKRGPDPSWTNNHALDRSQSRPPTLIPIGHPNHPRTMGIADATRPGDISFMAERQIIDANVQRTRQRVRPSRAPHATR